MGLWRVLLSLVLLAGLSPAIAATKGKTLFKQHCAACHGEAGAGGIGLPLSKAAVMHSLTDAYIRTTIRTGRPGRIMPSFEQLSAQDVDAIVQYMRTWGESRVKESATPVQGSAGRGKPLFEQHCSRCHGEDLSGGSQGTGVTFSRQRDLPIMPPALNNAGFLLAASDGMLRYIIQQGREGTPMPAFTKILDKQQVDDIISYMRASEATYEQSVSADGMTIIHDVSGTFEETVAALRESIRSNNFRVFPDRYLEQGLAAKSAVNQRQITLRFCNFNKLYEALKLEPRLGVILPCAITVIENDTGQVQLVTANVEQLAKLFNNDQLDTVFIHIQESYQTILDEVAF